MGSHDALSFFCINAHDRIELPTDLPCVLAPGYNVGIDAPATAMSCAGVAELVDAAGLGPAIARCGGSSPFARTTPPHWRGDRQMNFSRMLF
ncbi:hypothetical protein SPHINGOT1_60141 [Sphingomonas sp. T1]|nr:hypothetical protein SPHINGOT1_60141 [Sphingomonas sp. T1]